MECRELISLAIDELTGETDDASRRELERHLEGCAACRAELSRVEESWRILGEDPDAPVTPEFRERTLALLEDEMIRHRVRKFRPRGRWIPALAYAAGLAAAAATGVWVARRPAATTGSAAATPASAQAAAPIEIRKSVV